MTTHEVSESIELPDPHTSRRLYQLGLFGLGAAMIALSYNTKLDDLFLLILGNAMLLLGAIPALQWARSGALHFPVFEMFMLTTIPFYAVSLLSAHPEAMGFSAAATSRGALAVVTFQATAIVAFLGTRGKGVRTDHLKTTLLPDRALRHAQLGIWVYVGYLYVNAFTNLIPHELGTVFRAIFSGIGMVSLFIQARRWGTGRLPSQHKFAISAGVALQLVFLFRDLYLISGISVLLLALIGYVSTSRRLPLLLIGVVLPVVAVLHNGKSHMRLEYWEQRAPAPTLTELPAFFQRWIEFGLEPPKAEGAESASLTGRLFERASLFQMLCLVTERTPDFEPYLSGESYASIPAQLVPSFLWPGKPSSLLSNILLAVHYRLVPEDDPTSVSIAFGMLAESYANFGLIGCALLGALLGFGYKRASAAAIGCPQFSALGLFTILLAAWSFQVEQIFATWSISLLQAATVVIGIPLAFRILFHQD